MGYELHIEKDKTVPISAKEWYELVVTDPELEFVPENGQYFVRFLGNCKYGFGNGWFDWNEGRISTKHPDNAILAKMLLLANNLDAKVIGDYGEIYVEPDINSGFHESTAQPRQSWIELFKNIILGLFPPKNNTLLPFTIGDRVCDLFNQGIITKIDRGEGLGCITVKYDDGREMHYAIVAHGLEKVPSKKIKGPSSN